jgi:glycosyltransferase involved in cell wall biosynthesis
MSIPSISVIIPTYNRSQEVLRAARSALAQTLAPLEIIVVDDASPDLPPPEKELIALDSRVRVVRREVNGGGSAARNTGLDEARGTWVALLDSDDHWLPGKLERQFAGLADPGRPGKVVAACNVMMRRVTGEERPYNLEPKPDDMPLSEWFLLRSGTYQTSGLLLGADFAREVRFDARLRRHQDWDFLLRLEAVGAEFNYEHEPLVIYELAATERVSQVGGYQRTLDWFGRGPGRVTPTARPQHYLRRCFSAHCRERPADATLTLMRYSMAYPSGVMNTMKHVARRLVRPASA